MQLKVCTIDPHVHDQTNTARGNEKMDYTITLRQSDQYETGGWGGGGGGGTLKTD